MFLITNTAVNAAKRRMRNVRNPPVWAVAVAADAETLLLTAAESIRMAVRAAVTEARRPVACTRMERALTSGISAAIGRSCLISSGLSITTSTSKLRLSVLNRPSRANLPTAVESAEARARFAWREALHPHVRSTHRNMVTSSGVETRRRSSDIFIFGCGVKTWAGFCGKLAVTMDGSCVKALFQFSH